MSGQYKIAWLCEALLVSRSGYYDWKERRRRPGPRQLGEHAACANAFERSSLAVVRPMAARGWPKCSVVRDDAIASRVSCVQSASLHGSVPSIAWPRPTVVTVDRLHLTVFKVLRVKRPNQVWTTDATCVLTGQGWLYLVAVLDVFTRRVIGWAMHQILDAPLVIAALRMALQLNVSQRHNSSSTPIAVAQFASAAYRQLLTQHRLLASMSRKGNCYDNAFIESFWSTLKYELVYHHRFATYAAARTAIFDYIETFYNRTRLHSSLAYQSPINFESKLNRKLSPTYCPKNQCKPIRPLSCHLITALR